MAPLEESARSRVTRAGTERGQTSTRTAWGSWLESVDVGGDGGTARSQEAQDSPGRSVDWGLASGRERRQIRHLAHKGHHRGKGGRR